MSESERRKINITARVQEQDRWIWHAPVMNKSDEWMEQYLQERTLQEPIGHRLPEPQGDGQAMERYMEEALRRCEIPPNPIALLIDRSGECYCGAYAHRDRELQQLRDPWGWDTAGKPGARAKRRVFVQWFGEDLIRQLEESLYRHYKWLLELERRVQTEIGTDEPACYWGVNGLPSKELRSLLAENDEEQAQLTDGGTAERYTCPGCRTRFEADLPSPETEQTEQQKLTSLTDGGTEGGSDND